jgi:hypothetical protein
MVTTTPTTVDAPNRGTSTAGAGDPSPDRVRLAAEHARLIADRDQVNAANRTAFANSGERVKAAEAAWDAANEEHQANGYRLMADDMTAELAIMRVERLLTDTAPPAIAAFVRDLDALRSEVNVARNRTEFRRCEPNGPQRPHDVVSNNDLVATALEQIDALVAEADGLKLLALAEPDVERRLEALQARVPVVPAPNVSYRW